MSAPLPDALRARFQRYIEEGLSGRAAALRLKLSPATGARWALAIRRKGRADAAPQQRKRLEDRMNPFSLFLKSEFVEVGDGVPVLEDLGAQGKLNRLVLQREDRNPGGSHNNRQQLSGPWDPARIYALSGMMPMGG